MQRREFITLLGGAAVAPTLLPLGARAQQPERVRRIGVLMPNLVDDPSEQTRIDAFVQALGPLGWTVGRNLQMDVRWGAGDINLLRRYATELVAAAPDVILASTNQAALEVKSATTTVPIVFVIGGDPVRQGLVASLNRPGGNVTGVTFINNALAAKRLELLRELVPASKTIAVLVNPRSLNAESDTPATQAAGLSLGLQLRFLNASTVDEIDTAFASLARQPADALFVSGEPFFTAQRNKIVALAARHSVPASFASRANAEAGGLMSYGTSIVDAHRQAGIYAGRILKGEKPSDLPVLQPTKFEFIINLKTAKALGLIIPQTLLVAADEVIE